MKLNIIVAVADDYAIGRDGNQPFFISDDLKHFKALTLGHPIIMGRKTFEALPHGALPGRKNIVITRNSEFNAENTTAFYSLQDAIDSVKDEAEAFIIGGGSIYASAMPYADMIYATHIHEIVPDADTHFPEIDQAEWIIEENSPTFTDSKTGLSFNFTTYTRANQGEQPATDSDENARN